MHRMSALSKISTRLFTTWMVFPKAGFGEKMISLKHLPSVLNSRLLLTTLLSTTAIASANTENILQKPTTLETQTTPPRGCCIVTPLVYGRQFWSHRTCLAGDLIELPHIAHLIGRSHNTVPTRAHTTDTEGEECHHWYDIDTQDFVKMVKRSEQGEEHMHLFDVREPEELMETGIIPGSVSIPLGTVEDAFNMSAEHFKEYYRVEKPTMDDPNIVFTCRAGVRSMAAMETLHHLGYTNARHYLRGWLGWEEHLKEEKSTDKRG